MKKENMITCQKLVFYVSQALFSIVLDAFCYLYRLLAPETMRYGLYKIYAGTFESNMISNLKVSRPLTPETYADAYAS